MRRAFMGLAFTLLATFSFSAHEAFAGHLVPLYEPGFWNASERIRGNNCYNYATNKATDTFAQPGRAYFGVSPIHLGNLTCDEVRGFASLDGTLQSHNGQYTFIFLGHDEWQPCPNERPAKLALVMNPGVDYHWYRVDAQAPAGPWSHKRGRTEARNWDESGNTIYSVATADRGGYVEVCGYFCSGSVHLTQNSGDVTIW